MGYAAPFFIVFVQIFAGKKWQILVQVACVDHIKIRIVLCLNLEPSIYRTL